MSEPEFSADEEREAAALRRALDEGRSENDLPGDALEVAALLRFSGPSGQLSSEQSRRVREGLFATLPQRPARRRAPLWIWFGALAGAGAFAALVLLPQPRGAGVQFSRKAESSAAEPVPASPPAQGALEAPADGLAARGRADESAPRLAQRQAEAEEPAAKGGGSAAAPDVAAVRQRLERAARGPRQELFAAAESSPLGPELERAERLRSSARSAADLERARAAVGAALANAGNLAWPPAKLEPLQQDLLQRLAETALRQGQPEQARDWARQGLALDGPVSPLLGLLWLTLGEADEALGDRSAAARSYMNALRINQELLEESLSP
jgi:tetratricopeptide (TPR) repeat protein